MAGFRNLDTASAALLVSMLSLPLGAGKIIPGGSFVSLFGDVIPSAGGLIAIWCAAPYVTYPLAKIKASAIGHILIAVAMIGFVAFNVIDFYTDPYARGAMVGW